VKFTF